MESQVYLVRHGETEWSLNGRHTGITDIPLTEKGRETAKLFQPFFARLEFAMVLTSPMQRARETARLAGFESEVDPDLREWNYGEYEGITSKEIHQKRPGWMIFKDGCPGGESPEQIGTRVDRLIAKVRKADGNVLLFAHGHVLRVLVARWIGFPPGAGAHFLLDTATLSILEDTAIKKWNNYPPF